MREYVSIFIAATTLLLPLRCQAQPPASTSVVTISITADGRASVDFDLTLPTPGSASSPDVLLLVLPIQSPTTQQIISPSDVRVTPLSGGTNHSIFVIASPLAVRRVRVSIKDGLKLGETPDGKAKLEFDFSYPFMSDFERALASSPGVPVQLEMEKAFSQ